MKRNPHVMSQVRLPRLKLSNEKKTTQLPSLISETCSLRRLIVPVPPPKTLQNPFLRELEGKGQQEKVDEGVETQAQTLSNIETQQFNRTFATIFNQPPPLPSQDRIFPQNLERLFVLGKTLRLQLRQQRNALRESEKQLKLKLKCLVQAAQFVGGELQEYEQQLSQLETVVEKCERF